MRNIIFIILAIAIATCAKADESCLLDDLEFTKSIQKHYFDVRNEERIGSRTKSELLITLIDNTNHIIEEHTASLDEEDISNIYKMKSFYYMEMFKMKRDDEVEHK